MYKRQLAIHEHEFISIIGPSGCGKSTLLRIVSELQERDGGEIVFHDNTLKENLGFVFQDSVLFPWKSVYENIIMPLEIKHQKTPESLMRVEKLLELMKLKEFRNSLPKELSGGMKQRASIARSLSYDPKLLLMDEPFGAVSYTHLDVYKRQAFIPLAKKPTIAPPTKINIAESAKEYANTAIADAIRNDA